MNAGTWDIDDAAAQLDTGYDLASLDTFEVGDITRALQRCGVSHRWDSGILAVAGEDYAAVETILCEAGIDPREVAGAPVGAPTDTLSSEDHIDALLDAMAAKVAGDVRFELEGWTEQDRKELEAMLGAVAITWHWEDSVLCVSAEHAALTEMVLEQLSDV